MSLSTEDGRSVDLPLDDDRTPQHLPPIPFPTESFSESIEGVTRRPISRATSIASKRMSYMTELRSKRDRSDTASLMTVDEITAEVENRVSKPYDREDDLDGWTKVDSEIDSIVPKAVADSDSDVDVEAETSDDVDTSDDDDEDETLREEEELSLDVDENGCIRNVVNAKTGTGYFLFPATSVLPGFQPTSGSRVLSLALVLSGRSIWEWTHLAACSWPSSRSSSQPALPQTRSARKAC